MQRAPDSEIKQINDNVGPLPYHDFPRCGDFLQCETFMTLCLPFIQGSARLRDQINVFFLAENRGRKMHLHREREIFSKNIVIFRTVGARVDVTVYHQRSTGMIHQALLKNTLMAPYPIVQRLMDMS